MPILKPIAGHNETARIEAYLEKDGRALARDFYNLSYNVLEHKRFPDIAIFKSKEYSDTIVLKNGISEALWDKEKTYIERMTAQAKWTKRIARRKRLIGQ